MNSSNNTKEIQYVLDTEGANSKLSTYNYFKYRPYNLMFGLHGNIIRKCEGFYEFNSLRKNILLEQFDILQS